MSDPGIHDPLSAQIQQNQRPRAKETLLREISGMVGTAVFFAGLALIAGGGAGWVIVAIGIGLILARPVQ